MICSGDIKHEKLRTSDRYIKIYHDLDQIGHDLDQIDHDLDQIDPNLPLEMRMICIVQIQPKKHVLHTSCRLYVSPPGT